jgi:hypothetical protein
MQYRVDENVMRQVVDYIARKPYAEVFQIMAQLEKSEPIIEEKEEVCEQVAT